MIIQRNFNGEEIAIALTDDEIFAAHKQFLCSWMIETAKEIDPNISDEEAVSIGIAAYDIYSEGNGDTEYESVQKAVEEYRKENKNKSRHSTS